MTQKDERTFTCLLISPVESATRKDSDWLCIRTACVAMTHRGPSACANLGSVVICQLSPFLMPPSHCYDV